MKIFIHLDSDTFETAPVQFDVWEPGDTTYEAIMESEGIHSEFLVSQDDSGDAVVFNIQWDRTQIEEGLARGESEFTVTGAYVSAPAWQWGKEFLAMWEEGRIVIPEEFTPMLTIHLRPDTLVTTYRQSESHKMSEVTVKKSTAFENAKLDRAEWLVQEENPYEEQYCEFQVEWNREEYEKGLESGAEEFIITGRYTSCVEEAYRKLQEQGLIKVEEGITARAKVCVQGRPEQPLVYEDLFPETRYVLAVPGDSFSAVHLPESVSLCLEGTRPFSNMREFYVRWNEEAYRKGIRSGKESFEVNGTYEPGFWDAEEREWWDEGYIRLKEDIIQPKAVVKVAKNSRVPFEVSLRPVNADETEFVPVFKFPGLINAEQLICAYSPDKNKWYEYEVPDYEWKSYQEGVSIMVYPMDEEGNEVSVSPEEPCYFKMVVKGSSLAGETEIFALNDPDAGEESNDAPVIDDGDPNIGDRGGGGQGEHDRDETVSGSTGQNHGNEAESGSIGQDTSENNQAEGQAGISREEGKPDNMPKSEKTLGSSAGAVSGECQSARNQTEERVLEPSKEVPAASVKEVVENNAENQNHEEEPDRPKTKQSSILSTQGRKLPGFIWGAAGTALFVCLGAAWVCRKRL